MDIWDTFIQETKSYDEKRFERFYTLHCSKLAKSNDLKDKKEGYDLITMAQWISALENKEDEEHCIKAWCYFIGKPLFYDKNKFFVEFVKYCNEGDRDSTIFGEKMTKEDKELKRWFVEQVRKLKRKWKDRMTSRLNYHISTSQNNICNIGKTMSEEEMKESIKKQKETRKRKRRSEKGTIYYKHPKGQEVELVCFSAMCVVIK